MKTLYLIRHAKSSWKDITLDDFDRPLNKRGKHDAKLMGKLLHTKHIKPDLILASPANRAMITAQKLAESIDYPLKKIHYQSAIYEASVEALLDVIRQAEDKVNTLFLIGHNPSLNGLLDYLVPENRVDNIVTTGIAEIELSIDRWEALAFGSGALIQFEFPKKYYQKP